MQMVGIPVSLAFVLSLLHSLYWSTLIAGPANVRSSTRAKPVSQPRALHNITNKKQPSRFVEGTLVFGSAAHAWHIVHSCFNAQATVSLFELKKASGLPS